MGGGVWNKTILKPHQYHTWPLTYIQWVLLHSEQCFVLSAIILIASAEVDFIMFINRYKSWHEVLRDLLKNVWVLRPNNNQSHIQMGPQFTVSSEGLVERGIEPTTPGLKGEWLSHCTTAAPQYTLSIPSILNSCHHAGPRTIYICNMVNLESCYLLGLLYKKKKNLSLKQNGCKYDEPILGNQLENVTRPCKVWSCYIDVC